MLGGRYELDHEIGRGGMGAVWLGHDTILDRDVAIKQIGMMPGAGEPDLQRAEREAHLAARINHQNVVAVFDLVDEDGFQWLVMEHVDGPTLAALIADRGYLDSGELAPIAEQVAGALAAAHDHDIVHRDVKPSNILLTSGGIAKLSDFGVARAQADASLTQTGLVTGSPAYLSPEVASGKTATSASDVWSLGATLFHALTGRPPYEVGDNVLGAMYRIVHDEPPRLDAGSQLAPLVGSMMQHDPAARPTMSEVATAIAVSSAHGGPPLDLESTQGFAAFDSSAVDEPAEPAPTTAFRPLTPPVTEPAPFTEPASFAEVPEQRASGRSRMIWIGAGAAAAVIAVIAFIGLSRGDNDPVDDQPSAAAGTPSAPVDTTATPDGPVDGVTAAALEGFAADYLTTAANDPDTGFTMLTPAYQAQSDGIKGYRKFWKRVSNIDVDEVTGNPQTMRVSYTYSYDFEGDRRTESVTLQLEKSGDSFLIAGAT